MKKIISIVIVLFLLSCQPENKVGTEKNAVQEQTQMKEFTEFEFHEEMHNFGTLQSGQIVVYFFEFKNMGTANLIIESAESDCGCVSVTFSGEPVLPGESGIIEVEFNSAGLFGKELKTIEIHANTKKPKQLVIFAEVKNEQIEYTY